MKVAIIHYWLISSRGGEKVLEEVCKLYPEADIYTHIYDTKALTPTLKKHKIFTTFISKLPFAKKLYKIYLPLMPRALEELDLSDYDLIISSESGPAKGIIPGPSAIHVCYCHSPMRYIWDKYNVYKNNSNIFIKFFMKIFFSGIRQWDSISANRVDKFIANSNHVKKRIKKYYRREAEVIHPPVDIDKFHIQKMHGDSFFLWVGELVSYKRPDILINAFNSLNMNLEVIGSGPEENKLKRIAGKNIVFHGKVSDEMLIEKYSTCKALILPGEEDFGIVPVEALASGKPVIGLNKGGLRDIINNEHIGVLYDNENEDSLIQAIKEFEKKFEFDPLKCRERAKEFSVKTFSEKIKNSIQVELQERAN